MPTVVTPAAAKVQKGASWAFTGMVYGACNPDRTVTWNVYGNTSGSTVINAYGLLKVAADETADTLTVTATSTMDHTKSGTATVTVTAGRP